jgi:S-adenosylmethionine decarboxylase
LKRFNLDNYLFGISSEDLSPREEKIISQRLQKEMAEIFYGENLR